MVHAILAVMAIKQDHPRQEPPRDRADPDIDPAIDALLDLLAEWSVLRDSKGIPQRKRNDP